MIKTKYALQNQEGLYLASALRDCKWTENVDRACTYNNENTAKFVLTKIKHKADCKVVEVSVKEYE